MDLAETISLLKEIVGNCSELNGKDFLIAPSKVSGSNVDGYEVHTTGSFTDTVRKYINALAVKKRSVTRHPDSILLYEAKTSQM